MNESLVPYITLFIGAILGLGTSFAASFLAHRQTISLRLLDQFLEVRKELVNEVIELVNLDSLSTLTEAQRTARRDVIAKLYYKHFDFLPQQVLNALALLRVALSQASMGPYGIEGNSIVRMPEDKICEFVNCCSVFDNAKYLAVVALKSKKEDLRDTEVVKLHARFVLYALNSFVSIADLSTMTTKLRKMR
jgi:hypothetical protein